MFTDSEYQQILKACRTLPKTINNYLENDFVMNLFSTVLDYQMIRTTLANAESHYKENHWHKIRTRDDLANFLGKYPDTKDGNIAAAQYLWGYRYWTRVHQLRGLVAYFDSSNVTDQESLREWAKTSDFDRDFKGKIKGLSFAIYKWLVMRQGVATIKPDSNVRKFLNGIINRTLPDREAVDVLERTARDLGIPANELDWSIWDFQSNRK